MSDERMLEAAFNELAEGQKLAQFIDSEFNRLGIPHARRMHCFATLVAAWLFESDANVTMAEVVEKKLYTDDEKLQPFMDEVRELVAVMREYAKKNQNKENPDANADGSTKPPRTH